MTAHLSVCLGTGTSNKKNSGGVNIFMDTIQCMIKSAKKMF